MLIALSIGALLFAAGCLTEEPAAGVSEGSTSDATTVFGSVGPYFTHHMFFNRDVSADAPASSSAKTISTLKAEGGWGNGNELDIDFSLDLLTASASTPMKTFTPTSDFYSPDCDHVAVPVPPGGNLEDESGYACTGDGDCHLLVVDKGNSQLYEMWRANITSSGFHGGCLAVWPLTEQYPNDLRGDGCTSADGAGFPIAPMLFTADEVAAGHIDHAIRFILPNNRIRPGHVWPATHASNTSGSSSAPAYGVHLRLRADYPVSSLSPGAQVVARALQKYGMYQADGGNIALTAQSDKHTTHKWSGLLGSHDLEALKVSDFEVISHGAVDTTDDCTRN